MWLLLAEFERLLDANMLKQNQLVEIAVVSLLFHLQHVTKVIRNMNYDVM